jgi:hypothetical protein
MPRGDAIRAFCPKCGRPHAEIRAAGAIDSGRFRIAPAVFSRCDVEDVAVRILEPRGLEVTEAVHVALELGSASPERRR